MKVGLSGRMDLFCDGLRAVGYQVHRGEPKDHRPGDVFVIWNRRGGDHLLGERVEKMGGLVLVVENAYIKREGYAISKRRHHGGGGLLVNDPARAAALGVTLQPWRADGGHVLVCPNRFIGPRADVMPEAWTVRTVAQLQRLTRRQVKVRRHPGQWKRIPPEVLRAELDEALRGAWACVIWWTTAGIKALIQGVPVVFCAPYWIAAKAAGRSLASIDAPVMGDRMAALEDIANGQFTIEEIGAGLPFQGLPC